MWLYIKVNIELIWQNKINCLGLRVHLIPSEGSLQGGTICKCENRKKKNFGFFIHRYMHTDIQASIEYTYIGSSSTQ